ncbi:hypothetical protein OROGR_012770 [Orobanche gracilis]
MNAAHFLRAGGHYMISTQANQAQGETMFGYLNKRQQREYKPIELVMLKKPIESNHAMAVGGFRILDMNEGRPEGKGEEAGEEMWKRRYHRNLISRLHWQFLGYGSSAAAAEGWKDLHPPVHPYPHTHAGVCDLDSPDRAGPSNCCRGSMPQFLSWIRPAFMIHRGPVMNI